MPRWAVSPRSLRQAISCRARRSQAPGRFPVNIDLVHELRAQRGQADWLRHPDFPIRDVLLAPLKSSEPQPHTVHALACRVSRTAPVSMRGAKRSVSTGPRMDVTSINTSTALSIVLSSIRCPAPFRVSKATTAAASVAATCGKVSAHIVDLAAGA